MMRICSKGIQYLGLLVFSLLLSGCGMSKRSVGEPAIWDLTEMRQQKTNPANEKYVTNIKKLGEQQRVEKNVVVTTNEKTFAPDRHYYCSVGPYWWPDPENPGKYINRDGYINPDRSQYGREKLSQLTKRCQNLGRAFYMTGECQYYDSFVQQLRAWFIDKDTYMYPNFEYAQVIPGQNGNKGRSTGMIDAYDFNTIIESIRLVNSVKAIDRRTMKALQSWFSDFAEWADDSYGMFYKKIDKNTSLAFDVTLANMYLFAGNEKRAKEIVDDFAALRIERQILDDGSQPSELKRTKSFSYSIFNLTHIIDMCYLARYWYPNYYLEHRERIDKAFEFLGQYVDNPDGFPYQQISSWEKCKKEYNKQLERIKKLRVNGIN